VSRKTPTLWKQVEKVRFPKLDKLIFGEIRKEKRVLIPSDTKKAVYERANKRCECCGMPLKISQGEFHHLRKPTAKSRPSTIQFLCPTHHRMPKLAHEWKTRTVRTIAGTVKKTYVKGKRVRKHPSSPHWREKPKTIKKKPTKRKTRKTTRTTRKKRR